jgi:hypothetical protein
MRPHRATAFVDAAPIGGRCHRTRQTCPMQRGKLVQSLWMILKTLDTIPCDRGGTVRQLLQI